MMSNMGVFNEELGELTFSILARSVLGDHSKDDFEHMDKLFRLLPVYRDVKSDVVNDNTASNSLNWRHKIDKGGEEVKTTELFFKSAIRQMVNNTYTSYDGKAKGYTNSLLGSQNKVPPTNPGVYMTKVDLMAYIDRALNMVKDDMNTNYLHDYKHIWPECVSADDIKGDIDVVAVLQPSYEEKKQELDVDNDDGAEKPACQDDDEDLPSDASDVDSCSEQSDGGNVDPDQGIGHPRDNRSWKSWGTINRENTMVGKRQRTQPSRLLYNKRRIGARFSTDPNL